MCQKMYVKQKAYESVHPNLYVWIGDNYIINEYCLGVLIPNSGSVFESMLMQKLKDYTENSQKCKLVQQGTYVQTAIEYNSFQRLVNSIVTN